MGIVDEVVREILNRVGVEGHRGRFDSDQTMSRGIVLSPREKERIGSMMPHPGQVQEGEQGEEILGSYTPMSSPGIITLYSDEIASFFWHHIKDILDKGYYMDAKILERLAHMTVIKTYTHEKFHHFSEVQRKLFGTNYHREMEEALAVAYSFLEISVTMRNTWNSKIGLLPAPVYRIMLQSIFRYKQHGYRDWVNFQTKDDFHQGLVSYLGPPSTGFLEKNGIDVAGLLIKMQETLGDQGVIEKMV